MGTGEHLDLRMIETSSNPRDIDKLFKVHFELLSMMAGHFFSPEMSVEKMMRCR